MTLWEVTIRAANRDHWGPEHTWNVWADKMHTAAHYGVQNFEQKYPELARSSNFDVRIQVALENATTCPTCRGLGSMGSYKGAPICQACGGTGKR